MIEVGKRLKALREGTMLSQTRMAEELGSTQSSINRYENGQSAPPVSLFRAYADYFDVSMDYIFARADKPQGKLYEYKPKVTPVNDQMKQFVEMCFDPDSPVSEKMKETLFTRYAGGETMRTIVESFNECGSTFQRVFVMAPLNLLRQLGGVVFDIPLQQGFQQSALRTLGDIGMGEVVGSIPVVSTLDKPAAVVRCFIELERRVNNNIPNTTHNLRWRDCSHFLPSLD